MPVIVVNSTMMGAYSVVCRECGGKEDWDIDKSEYEADPKRWDNYVCQDCRHPWRR